MIDRIQKRDRFHRLYAHPFIHNIGLDVDVDWNLLLDCSYMRRDLHVKDGAHCP